MSKKETSCSFCGRPRSQVGMLIAGLSGHICESCVQHAEEIIEQELSLLGETKKGSYNKKLTVKKPKEINYIRLTLV